MRRENNMRPELYSDEDIDEFAQIVYESCNSQDCDNCSRRLEVNGETCMADIICDLWRKWKNAQAKHDAADIRMNCEKHNNN